MSWKFRKIGPLLCHQELCHSKDDSGRLWQMRWPFFIHFKRGRCKSQDYSQRESAAGLSLAGLAGTSWSLTHVFLALWISNSAQWLKNSLLCWGRDDKTVISLTISRKNKSPKVWCMCFAICFKKLPLYFKLGSKKNKKKFFSLHNPLVKMDTRRGKMPSHVH